MDDRLCFVQFLHPGGEHLPEAGMAKPWNTGNHRRKFMVSNGRFLSGNDLHVGDLVFWGEWEPESRVIAEIVEPVPDGPRWVYWPYYVPTATHRGLQNTDPFEFGERFHYTGCMQHTKRGSTQLRHLARGSVILFGSCLHKSHFAVDTVFVVADHIDHSKRDFRSRLQGRVSETYEEVTIAPWYENMVERHKSHRLYSGASFDSPIEGMFSFFPCLPYEEAPLGFARPTIQIPGVISGTKCQGFTKNEQGSVSAVRALWEDVRRQVTDQNLKLGIEVALPSAASPQMSDAGPIQGHSSA